MSCSCYRFAPWWLVVGGRPLGAPAEHPLKHPSKALSSPLALVRTARRRAVGGGPERNSSLGLFARVMDHAIIRNDGDASELIVSGTISGWLWPVFCVCGCDSSSNIIPTSLTGDLLQTRAPTMCRFVRGEDSGGLSKGEVFLRRLGDHRGATDLQGALSNGGRGLGSVCGSLDTTST